MGVNNVINNASGGWKPISYVGLSLSALLLMLLLFIIPGATGVHSTSGASQQDPVPERVQLVCSADMISYWKLDETTGTVFVDAITGNDASCSGSSCPAFADGAVEGARRFDGVDDGLTAPDDPKYDWDGTDSFSVELWVKTASCDESVFLGKHELPPAGSSTWWLGCGESGDHPAFALRDSSTAHATGITATDSIADNAWHHLVGVHDAPSTQMRLYVDGALAVTRTHTFPGDFTNANPVTFGFHHTQWHATATIDEVAIYDAVLSESEIEAHYEKGLAGLDYCNQTPVANDGSHVTAVDVPVNITLDYDDIDGPGPHTISIVDGPDHGALSGSGANRTYTPAPGYTGSDTFTWRVNDGLENSNIATIGILITETGDNESPVANSQSVSTTSNTPLSIELTYSDPDNGPGPNTITIVDGPDHGTLTGSGTDRTYTPDEDYVGPDSFTWQVSDGVADSNVATVSIQVQNQPPVAQSNSYQTTSGAGVSIELQYTDPDNAPGPYTFTIVDGPDHGTLTGSGANRTYTPQSNYGGPDSFTWRVNDGAGDSNVATVSINVVQETYWLYLPLIETTN